MAKNLHMQHLEDAVLYNGVDGTRQAINALQSLRDMLAGSAKGRFNTTVKWDGAPAVFAGSHPAIADGQFFVAKKGIFNKNPKVYTTDAEIDADTSGDLAEKLKASLKYLPQLGIQGIVQGDLMFTEGDKRVEEIDGTKYIVFQPNTIAYAVPVDSGEGRRIAGAKLGIVFHTRYTGDNLEDMQASFDVDANEFRKAMDVWYQDAQVRDLSGTASMTAKETAAVTQALSAAGKIFNQISGDVIRELESKRHIAQMIETYNNRFVREGKPIGDTAAHATNLVKFIQDKFGAEIEKRKTAAGKATQQAKLDEIMEFFSPDNLKSIKSIFDLQKALVVAKLMIVRKLETLSKLDTFVLTQNGYRVTGEEGYVAVDRLNNGAYKLVDRMEFSSKNFNPDIIKGWQRPGSLTEEEEFKTAADRADDSRSQTSRKIVVAFGRFNPPTVGHEKLIEKVKSVAAGGEYAIFASHSNDPKKNPLGYDTKIAFMRDMFPAHAKNIRSSDAKSIFQVMQSLNDDYSDVVVVAGSDRVPEFQERLSKYNGSDLYQMDSVEVVSAGERDPDAEGVEGMSASKMRKVAAANDYESFTRGLPAGYDGRKLFLAVRAGMKLSELTEVYERMVGQPQEVDAAKLKVLLETITRLRDLVEKMNPNYGKGLGDSTKSKRSAQFDKQADMADDNPAAYKPAPGDARAETKPSKHTKKFKDMYGEDMKCWKGYRRVPGKTPGTKGSCKKIGEDVIEEISAAAEKSLRKKADKTGISYGILKQVYNRGMAAWKTGHRPGASQQAWAHARVNSFATKSSGTWGGADKDLAAKVRKSKKKK